MADIPAVLYWDTSALLSLFFADEHSGQARKCENSGTVHLLSSLAHAEASAVIARITRAGMLDPDSAATVHTAMTSSPWRVLNGLPDRLLVTELSRKWPLRGADLWHLAMAVSLKRDLPEISMLTFDACLLEAAVGEGLAHQQ
jgi:predicted nucleic acid-binding protein